MRQKLVDAATATNADTVDGKHNGELTAQYFSAGKMLTHNDTINTILSGVYSYISANNPTGSIGNNCILVAFRTRDRTDNLQIVSTLNDRTLYYRIAGNIGIPEYETWTAWREFIHSDNYNKYAPSLTGSGAYGTWGISISGNAATATNADTLDGYHETGFYRAAKQYISSGDMAKLEAGSYYNGDTLGDINPLPHMYSSLSVLGKSFYSQQLCVTFDATRAWLRGIINSTTITVSDWHELAFTDSNVASATKLQTPRTIWGQSFDGTSDVSGDAHITGDLIVDGEVSALVA